MGRAWELAQASAEYGAAVARQRRLQHARTAQLQSQDEPYATLHAALHTLQATQPPLADLLVRFARFLVSEGVAMSHERGIMNLLVSSFDTHLLCLFCRLAAGSSAEPTIPTTTGELVHVTCADRKDAAAVAHHRQQQALAQGVLTIVVDMILLAYAQFLAGCCCSSWLEPRPPVDLSGVVARSHFVGSCGGCC